MNTPRPTNISRSKRLDTASDHREARRGRHHLSETATMAYLRFLATAAKLQAGEFQFPSPVSTLQVLKILEKGEDRTIKLTIPEGFTRFDIAKRIAEKFPQNPPMDDKAILALMDDVTLIRDISPTAKNLEGYMYPTTYNFRAEPTAGDHQTDGRSVSQILETGMDATSEIARPHAFVTIASLIETETGVETERPIVAGIINNRLAKNIPLGIDQTNVYIAKMLGKWDGTIHKSDLEVDSPYNTRTKTGIPPGPISSVTESSIKAALNPRQTTTFSTSEMSTQMTARIGSTHRQPNLKKARQNISNGWKRAARKNVRARRIRTNDQAPSP
ncbi:MAG: endolytic transglycosylase MltG [Chloracidobacterium sp.]|nr:endolytic transglycosylase MltG [Chloracidobacterium sp.]